ncbi:40S ribosomal protein S21 [Fasciola hepatica]|uniref:40S ribosomal protein S21 n=1 Tax=Fasciola hepatica TaxID=6192 RepID=A0A4E0RZ09_FASHE|nr:40S ribosomal protein S21 [Fasciola hepatica]
MQNEAGEFVDIYLPRRCAVTNRLIGAKDHASIQLRFVELDPTTGRMTNEIKTYDIAGDVRSMELLRSSLIFHEVYEINFVSDFTFF